MNRGLFAWGPKVADNEVRYIFGVIESLATHESDDGKEKVTESHHTTVTTNNRNEQASGQSEAPEIVLNVSARCGQQVHFDSSERVAQNIPTAVVLSQQTNEVAPAQIYGTFGASSSQNPIPTLPYIQMEASSLNSREEQHPSSREDAAYPDNRHQTDHSAQVTNTILDSPISEHESALSLDTKVGDGYAGESCDDLDGSSSEQEAEEELLQDVGGRSRIPGFMEWIQENRGWLDLFFKHGLTLSAMDDILSIIKAPCKAWKTVVNTICRSSGLVATVQYHPYCPGHMCLAGANGKDALPTCTVCGRSSSSLGHPRKFSVGYLPVLPRISKMVRTDTGYKDLYAYRRNQHNDMSTLRDYFDSPAFRKLCEAHGGAQNLENDVFLAVSTDGFQAFKNDSVDVWPVLAVILNLPPHQRYSCKNVMPLMFLPDGSEPKNLQSYLVPLYNEIMDIHERGGSLLRFHDGSLRRVRIHLVWFTADLVALKKILNVVGHNGKHPCRYCIISGTYTSERKRYYYPCRLQQMQSNRTDMVCDPRNLPLRTVESIKRDVILLQNARNKTDRDEISKSTGVSGPSIMCDLPGVVPYTSFPPDIMHLFYNVQKLLLELHMNEIDDLFTLHPDAIDVLDQELAGFGDGISGQMAPKPRPISAFRRWKASEHKMFTLNYCLILFDGHLPKQYLDGLNYFVSLMDICFQSAVTPEDSEEAERLAICFIEHFERFYVRYRRDRMHFCRYVMHLLLHLGKALSEHGPLINCSQYWVEQYIGWILERSNARTLPAISMFRNTVFSEARKLFYDIPTHEENDEHVQLSAIGGFKTLGSKPARLSRLGTIGRQIRKCIAEYLLRKIDGIQMQDSIRIANSVDSCILSSRVKFLSGLAAQVASIVSNNATIRPSCYVACEMDVTENTADIYYGRLLHIIEFEISDEDALKYSMEMQKFCVVHMDWARKLQRGSQNQVFTERSKGAIFTGQSVEDASIIRRLIGVVEHSIPPSCVRVQGGEASQNSSRSGRARSRKRAYFIDENIRSDQLLARTRSAGNGLNRRLNGFLRR